MKILWALIFIFTSQGHPTHIKVHGTLDTLPDCRAMVKEYTKEIPPEIEGYFHCLGVRA